MTPDVLIALPGLPMDDSVWESDWVGDWIRTAQIHLVGPVPNDSVAEAIPFGMRLPTADLAIGPLTVYGLNVRPPSDANLMAVTLLGVSDGAIQPAPVDLALGEVAEIGRELARLNTKRLTLVPGTDSEMGLVWEGAGHLLCQTPAGAIGRTVAESLPEGDFERPVRQFIEDSVNILDAAEFNCRRRDEGRAVVNLAWPYGAGIRPELRALSLQRGTPVRVVTDDLRTAGMARLLGVRPLLSALPIVRDERFPTIAVFTAPGRMNPEDRDRWLYDFHGKTLSPLLESRVPLRLAFPGSEPSFGITYNPERPASAQIPLRPEVLQQASPRDFIDADGYGGAWT